MNHAVLIGTAFAVSCVVCAQENPTTNQVLEANAPETTAKEIDSGFFAEANADVYSAYVWRGIVINDHPVLQPEGIVGWKGDETIGAFAFGVWSTMNLTSRHDVGTPEGKNATGKFSETDFNLNWNRDFGPLNLELGWNYYYYKYYTDANINELYALVTYNNDFVTPYIQANWDVDESTSLYTTFGLNREFGLSDRFTLGLDAALGWGSTDYVRYYFNGERDDGFGGTIEDNRSSGTLTDYTGMAYLSYALTDAVSLRGTLAYSGFVDNSIRNSAVASDELGYQDLLWYGLGVSAAFE